jgi:hypothetical protein
MSRLPRFTGPISSACDHYVQYLLAGTNPSVLNRHRRVLQPWRCRLSTTPSPPFPTDGPPHSPNDPARSPFKSLDKKLQITLDVKEFIADTWSRDHSAFYRSLHLATTNGLLLAIGYTRIIGKEFSNATRFQSNSYDLMHKQ